MRTVPAVGVLKPHSSVSSVVFPDPLPPGDDECPAGVDGCRARPQEGVRTAGHSRFVDDDEGR